MDSVGSWLSVVTRNVSGSFCGVPVVVIVITIGPVEARCSVGRDAPVVVFWCSSSWVVIGSIIILVRVDHTVSPGVSHLAFKAWIAGDIVPAEWILETKNSWHPPGGVCTLWSSQCSNAEQTDEER